jgi:thioredoxin 1
MLDSLLVDTDFLPGDAMADLAYVSEDTFQREVLNSLLPVVVDFTATWCGPCKTLEPVVKQLADEWAGKAKIVKLDVDQNANLTMQYGVMGVPTLMLFVNGKESQRLTGYQPKDRIVAKFKQHI